jgi:hypothetical protein
MTVERNYLRIKIALLGLLSSLSQRVSSNKQRIPHGFIMLCGLGCV